MNASSVQSEDWTSYSCVFQFSGVEDNIITKLNKSTIRTNWGKIKLAMMKVRNTVLWCFCALRIVKNIITVYWLEEKLVRDGLIRYKEKKLPPSLSYYTLRFVPFYWLHRSKEAAPNMWITNLKFTFSKKCLLQIPGQMMGECHSFSNFTLLLYIIIIQLLLAFFRPALKYAVNTIYLQIYIIYIYFYRHTYSHICSTIEITVLHKYSVS